MLEFATQCKGRLKPGAKRRYFVCIHSGKADFSNKLKLNQHRYEDGCNATTYPDGQNALLLPYPDFLPGQGEMVENMGKGGKGVRSCERPPPLDEGDDAEADEDRDWKEDFQGSPPKKRAKSSIVAPAGQEVSMPPPANLFFGPAPLPKEDGEVRHDKNTQKDAPLSSSKRDAPSLASKVNVARLNPPAVVQTDASCLGTGTLMRSASQSSVERGKKAVAEDTTLGKRKRAPRDTRPSTDVTQVIEDAIPAAPSTHILAPHSVTLKRGAALAKGHLKSAPTNQGTINDFRVSRRVRFEDEDVPPLSPRSTAGEHNRLTQNIPQAKRLKKLRGVLSTAPGCIHMLLSASVWLQLCLLSQAVVF